MTQFGPTKFFQKRHQGRIKAANYIYTKMFKLQPEKENATITMKIADMKHKMRVKMVQCGVNSNKATSIHKL